MTEYIAVEGIDLSGKDTFIKKYYNDYFQICEPSRPLDLKGRNKKELYSIFMEDRCDLHFECKTIFKKVDVCSNRCFLSTLAYQNYKTEQLLKSLVCFPSELEYGKILIPNKIIYLDVKIETVKERLKNRKNKSVFDTDLKMLTLVKSNYIKWLMYLDKYYNVNYEVIKND